MLMTGNGVFDPDTIEVVQDAFDLAWEFLQRDPVVGGVDRSVLRESLARELLNSVGAGEMSGRQLANQAIPLVRRFAQLRVAG